MICARFELGNFKIVGGQLIKDNDSLRFMYELSRLLQSRILKSLCKFGSVKP